MSVTQEQVFDALRVVEDPELGMDVVDLGLVYDVRVEDGDVTVTYSLTSMGCPAGAMIQEQMQQVVSSMEGVENVVCDLTWTPPWSPEMMSDDAKFVLGF
jgi:metal-sulfur cluster biosynthetic enzyme